jgi:hypothetical protein
MMNARITVGLLLPVLLAATVALRAENAAESALPPRPFHLESKDGKRWDATFTVKHGPFHGVIFYAVPPNDPCQTIRSAELFAETKRGRVNAVRTTDAGPFKKPVLKLEVNAAAPFTVVAHVDVQIHQTKLAAGAPRGKVMPLGPLQHREFLDDGWPDANARAWFTEWMKTHKLIRGGEDEAAFAFRALKFMQEHFRYVIPDNIPEHKAMVARDPEMGDWHYTIGTFTGECLRISDTYCRVMRMNGIPARLVSGNWLAGDKGHHLRSLIWLPDTGWIPVEATDAVGPPKKPALNFFGTWGGPMLVGNRNIDFELPGPKDQWNIGTFDQIGFAGADGKWDFPAAEIEATVVSPQEPKR